jgi:hypothetical protein
MKSKTIFVKFYFLFLMLVCGLWSASPIWADVSDNAIQIEPDCLRVEIQDTPLPEVARVLTRESGIEIRFPISLMGEFITSRLKAKNCSSVVLWLLQDFSRMKFWSDDGHLIAVQLLGRKQAGAPDATTKVASASLVSTSIKPKEPQARMDKDLDLEQLQTLIDVGKGIISPWEVVNDPVYKPFLLQAGLMDSANWEDEKKLDVLHKRALRVWKKQNRAKRSR